MPAGGTKYLHRARVITTTFGKVICLPTKIRHEYLAGILICQWKEMSAAKKTPQVLANTKMYRTVENGNVMERQNEELRRINAELDRFVYSASHDLRAPLMSVKGLLNMIKLDPDKKNTDLYLALIEKSVGRLDNFITDIIQYSRNTRTDIEEKEIDLALLLQESLETLRFMEGAEQVRITHTVDVRAPFYSDPGRLLVVLNNIISNAVRYRNMTRSDACLDVTIHADGDLARIRFTDNGIGIPVEYQEAIFDMFFRVSTERQGSGLGLYIVKDAVSRLQGTVHVQSTPGKGTTFIVEIPNQLGQARLQA
jgi:signal transduction histidine kinase